MEMETFNVYCDESCHLEHDGQRAMVLGAVWCPAELARELSSQFRRIKQDWGLSRELEVKWTKVSGSKVEFYLAWIRRFFEISGLHFRALVVPDKSKLDHASFPGQDHNEWYYKMYFDMLKVILSPKARFRIYLDLKDTRGGAKVRKLHEVLCNSQYDFDRKIIERVQQIRSHEADLLQLADLLIGAVSYANRDLGGNSGKNAIVAEVRRATGYSLRESTLLREEKFNLLQWRARESAR